MTATVPERPVAPESVPSQPASGAGRQQVLQRLRPLLGPGAVVALLVLFGSLYPDTFLSRANLVDNLLGQVAVVAIVACVQTMVMVVGDFDLSVSGLGALAMVWCGTLLTTTNTDGTAKSAWPVLAAVAVGLLVGLVGGIINGLLVSYLGVMAFIATLGTSVVFSNMALNRVNGKTVYSLVEPGFVDIARAKPLGIPALVWFAAGVAVLVWFLLDQTPLGRRMYAVGGNPEAARLSGIDVKRVRFIAFALCGVGVAFAAILQSAYVATANTTAPQPWMLTSIAAVFLGMSMFRNGRPNLLGTILGIVFLRLLANGLGYTDLSSYTQNAIGGAVIVLAVLPPAIARLRDSR
jgi:ribose transport system permease protein